MLRHKTVPVHDVSDKIRCEITVVTGFQTTIRHVTYRGGACSDTPHRLTVGLSYKEVDNKISIVMRQNDALSSGQMISS